MSDKKEQPLFEIGQFVICAQIYNPVGIKFGRKNPLLEGKRYRVTNPKSLEQCGQIYIEIAEHPGNEFNQKHFIPESFNNYAENEFHEALKGVKQNSNRT